jgi:PKD repeat protein
LNIVSGKVVSAEPEVPLIDDWCQQFSSHSNDDVVFGPDGKLYVSAGEGASFNAPDYGQFGNPCGDPPFEGGSLRSQDFRTPGDPLGYNGTVLRVDPQNPNTPQVVAYGLRNPYRLAFNPRTTGELWSTDAGSSNSEELNRIPDATTEQPLNFGWPCYEGKAPAPGFVGLRSTLPLCDLLYDPSGQGNAPPAGQTPGATLPYFRYNHDQRATASDGCVLTAERVNPVSSAVTGIAFYRDGDYPAPYHDALFFTDYARRCIWAMEADDSGVPDPNKVSPFVAGDVAPVDLQIGPNGDLFYVDIALGTIHRITYQDPVAVIAASTTSGAAPLTVTFDGTGSTPIGAVTYSWDFDGDGTWDSTDPQPTHTYAVGEYTARLRVVKNGDTTSNTTSVRISAGNTPPSATIAAPGPSLQWRVGQVISFGGVGSDAQDGALPASAYTWAVVLHHGTHEHPLQTLTGVTGGSFVAPDHEYPAWLELRLTVRDSANVTAEASVELYPQTVTLSFTSSPAGATIAHNFAGQPAPFSSTVILGSHNTVSTTAPGGMVLTMWMVNDQAAGWAPGLSLLADGDKTIAATFGTPPQYDDVAASHSAYRAVSELGARGLLKGYGDGRFGPEDKLLRAQIAVLLVRALGWGGEQHPNPFTDGGGIAPELWDAVATLAARGIARGYDADTYGPNDQVLQAQAISLIARTMVAQGYWQYQPDNPALYPAVPASAGHRVDLATFAHYAGALPDVPTDQPFAAWNQPATRGWFARALWQALDSYWGTGGSVP